MSLEGLEHHREYHRELIENTEKGKKFNEMFEPERDVFVDLVARAFDPKQEALSESEEAIIFIPGWLMTAQDKSIDGLCQALARRSGRRVYAVSTEGTDCRSERRAIDLLYEEARGIAAFIRQQGIKDVILAGHSRGGNEAIDLAAILQKESGITVRGLIALNSAGLFSQSSDAAGLDLSASIPAEVTTNAFRGLTDPNVGKHQMQFATDMAMNLASTMMKFNVSYPFRLKDEADEANTLNPRLKDIECPVVFVFGKEDKVASMHQKRAGIKALVPRASTAEVIVVDAGHMWPLEEPAAAARRTLEALGRGLRQKRELFTQ